MTSPFDYTKALLAHKHIINESDDPEQMIKDYKPYFTNKVMSYYLDTLPYANDMNINSSVDGLMHYDYFYYSIRKMKRNFVKWMKVDRSPDIAIIQEFYQVGVRKAEEILRILTPDQLKKIKEKLEKGG